MNLPRKEYSDDFAQFMDVDSNEHEKYKEGLIAIGGSILLFFVLWATILLILKCTGKPVGCAAGFTFEPLVEEVRDTNDQEDSDNHNNHQRNHSSTTDHRPSDGSGQEPVTRRRPSRRERISQALFFIFGAMTLVCAPLSILLVFDPLRESINEADNDIIVARDVESQIYTSLETAQTAMVLAESVAQESSVDFDQLCPTDNPAANETFLQFLDDDEIKNYFAELEAANQKLKYLATMYSNGFNETGNLFAAEMELAVDFHDRLENSLDSAERSQVEFSTYIWVIPCMVIGMACATVIAIFGVMLAMKRTSSQHFQQILSYGILPLLVITSVLAWILAAAAAVSTIVADDTCNHGSSDGYPQQTVIDVLDHFNMTASNSSAKFVLAYTGNCVENASDPTEGLKYVENIVQADVDDLWAVLDELDRLGKSKIIRACGGEEDQIEKVLLDSRNLARSLTTVRRAMALVSTSLSCDRLYPLYVDSIEGTVCSDTTPPIAWAFLIFCVMGMSTLAMITLRASWSHELEADDLYSEDEVDENMFVDEYEEYLAYISKYKHEWEEYEGLDTTMSVNLGNPRRSPSRAIMSPFLSDIHDEHSRTESDSFGSIEAKESRESNLVGENLFDDEKFLIDEHENDEEEDIDFSAIPQPIEPPRRTTKKYTMQAKLQKTAPFNPYQTGRQNHGVDEEDTSFFSLSEGSSTPSSADGQTLRGDFAQPENLLHSTSTVTDDTETDDVMIENLTSAINQERSLDLQVMRQLEDEIDQERLFEPTNIQRAAPEMTVVFEPMETANDADDENSHLTETLESPKTPRSISGGASHTDDSEGSIETRDTQEEQEEFKDESNNDNESRSNRESSPMEDMHEAPPEPVNSESFEEQPSTPQMLLLTNNISPSNGEAGQYFGDDATDRIEEEKKEKAECQDLEIV